MIIREDLKCILTTAVHVAKLDRQFVAEEHHLLVRLMDGMELRPDERDALLTEDQVLSHLIGQLSSPEARRLLMKTICAVAVVDGLVVDAEERFFERVKSLAAPDMELPPKDEWGQFVEEVQTAFSQFGG